MATPPNLLLDTSALLKRWVDERGSTTMVALLSQPDLRGHLFCAAHVEGEFLAAMNRRYRELYVGMRGLRTAITAFYQQFPDLFVVVPLSPEVLFRGHLILHTHPEANVSAADAYHLAALAFAAQSLDTNPFVFVSSDRSLLTLARRLGSLTWDPERDSVATLLA